MGLNWHLQDIRRNSKKGNLETQLTIPLTALQIIRCCHVTLTNLNLMKTLFKRCLVLKETMGKQSDKLSCRIFKTRQRI